jgi:hypothetical protein
MTRRAESQAASIIAALAADPAARLAPAGDGRFRLVGRGGAARGEIAEAQVIRQRAAGLLVEAEAGSYAASPAASAFVKRRAGGAHSFRAQHSTLAEKPAFGGAATLVDLDESPVASLARRSGKGGSPWLAAHAVAAAERFRRDFEIGRLQPRVTANWSASVADGRRSGDGGGMADLTDMALAARRRFDGAVVAVGPELSGVLVDICCFVKGLETVERERQWPARSAKLVLRLALDSLARHYGLTETATGRAGGRKIRQWGADGYRPEIT